ncbi:hypothetical protein JG688_00001197 [Phytophthora aleatoria]|uniref:Kinesin-like protein n=1 Tax=Phytophthora aleatoria TaxID=2496075 RepID=A0A8J5J3Y1_9STRA|nr:hypothetical protein JG688_00001197 [Phytophthora aleatoria]
MGSAAETRVGIRVCARFRPQNKLEQKHQAVECVHLEDNTVARVRSEARGVADDHTFTFDQVFGTKSSQLNVYEATAKPLVMSTLRGYNCTCFVYGQTGSGKTFSMEGVPGDKDYEGIIPRVMADIFDGIQNMQADLEFIVRVSYVEIYMEKIRDLLKPTSTNLNVRESRERGVWIAGATEVCCATAEEMQSVMRLGGANRVISSTRMNSESSRSHSVFIITIEQRNTATESMKSGKLFLVDLAGSEKVGKTHAQGQTLKEAQHINKSLSALGSVMNALTSGNANTHIPYRDSKLTRLLQDSLGGNSETTLLVCASSSSFNSEETISTLRFGTRAKNIKNKPKVNEERTVAEFKILVAEKDKWIASLEALLREAKATDTDEPVDSTAEEQLKKFAAKVEELEDDQASKAAEIASLEDRCVELEEKNKDLEEKEREVSLIVSRSEDFKKKLGFLQSELEAKAKECEELNQMLTRRKQASVVEMPPLSTASTVESEVPVQAPIDEDSDKVAVDSSSVPVVVEYSGEGSPVLENEFLRQQLSAKAHELKTRLNARYHKNHVHENALCDGCGMSPIVGGKWKCNTCDNYELCDGCYAAGIHGFEVSNELCRRVEQLAVQKYRLLGDYPELFELFRRHICHDNVIQFRRVVEWLCAIVSGARSQKIYHKMIVKSGLHPDIRSRLVAQLGALASERTDISLKTEWFIEMTPEEEAACSDDGAIETTPVELDGDKLSPTSSSARLETLRMYLTDASGSKQSDEPGAPAALLDLLDPSANVDVDGVAAHSSQPPPTLRRTVSAADTSAEGDHDRVGQLPDMPRKQSLDLPIYGSQRVKSVT